MYNHIKGIILLFHFLFFSLGHASSQSVPQLARKALSASVALEVRGASGDTLGQGSGFFVRRDLVATNFHVIDGAKKVNAKLVGTGITHRIEGVVATDETNDLALIKVTTHGVTPLPLGDSDKVQIGETVYVVGNPKGLEGTFSDGIISARRDSGVKRTPADDRSNFARK